MTELALKTFYHVPVVGWAVKDALRGRDNAGWWFLLNCVLLLALAVMTWGYAAVIVFALAMTAFMLVTLVVLTAGW